jgi:TolA-binding protein
VQGLLEDWAASKMTYEAFIQAYSNHRLIRDAWYGLGWAQKGQQEHADAIESFSNVVKDSKKDELGARAVYQLGDSHYQIAKASKNSDEVQASCTESIIIFADLGANYPEELGSPKGVWQARALLGTGMALELVGKKGDAKKQYQNLVQKYPDSNAAAIAKGKLN